MQGDPGHFPSAGFVMWTEEQRLGGGFTVGLGAAGLTTSTSPAMTDLGISSVGSDNAERCSSASDTYAARCTVVRGQRLVKWPRCDISAVCG